METGFFIFRLNIITAYKNKSGNHVNHSKNYITQIGLIRVTFALLKTNLIQKP